MTPVVGVDPSTKNTGFSAINCRNCDNQVISITPSNKMSQMEKLQFIRESVMKEVLRIYNQNNDLVVFIEGFSYGCKGRGVYVLAGLGYMIRYDLWESGVPYYEVSLRTWIKGITGNGSHKKEDVMRVLDKTYGVRLYNTDESDAYGIGLFGSIYMKGESFWKTLSKARLDAFKSFAKEAIV